MSVSEAFAAVAWETLRQMQANEEGTLEGADAEFLHQMRVALRRLRSTFSAFSRALPPDCDAKVKSDLRWLGSRLGPARDWDVFVTETLPSVVLRCGDNAGVRAACCPQRRGAATAAQREVRRALRSRRYPAGDARPLVLARVPSVAATARTRAARAGLRRPVRAYAQSELEAPLRAGEKARAQARASSTRRAGTSCASRSRSSAIRSISSHRCSTPEASRALRARLARLQDILGTMNDAATLQRLLSELACRYARTSRWPKRAAS